MPFLSQPLNCTLEVMSRESKDKARMKKYSSIQVVLILGLLHVFSIVCAVGNVQGRQRIAKEKPA